MDTPSERWQRRARQTRRKINCGWCLQVCATPVVGVALGLLGPALWARRVWPEAAPLGLAWVTGAALAVIVPGSWWLARRRFVTAGDALVRLEAQLGLHNRLSTAAAGVCPWPPLPDRADDGIRWSFSNTFLPLLAAAALLAAAIWVPVKARLLPEAPDEPAAWAATEEDLRDLARQDAVAPEALDETQQRIAELRAQAAGKWFSHASLEATDKLRESHLQAMAELQRQLRMAAQSATRLAGDAAGEMPAPTRAGLQDQFKQAVQGMQAGGMKPNKELLEQLRNIDPKQLRQLDKAQMEQLMQGMKDKAEVLGKCLCRKTGDGQQPEGEAVLTESSDGPGKGGVDRGPGTTPEMFGEPANEVAATQPQVLESSDLTRALPGDVLDVTDSKHEVEMTRPALRTSGKADVQGGGGSSWQESLHPREQESVKKFFDH
ncbi:MAG: hypothetical protein WCP45_02905 [Verrucomicrobiota bacterium]